MMGGSAYNLSIICVLIVLFVESEHPGGEMVFTTQTRLSAITRAIVQTAAYADVFDYPLTVREIHRYLAGIPARLQAVEHCLEAFRPLSRVGEYYTLPGRELLAEERRRREARAARLWPEALRYGGLLARLPFIRMVAVTGALAMNNVKRKDDIDYLLVTEPGRLWLSRLLALVVARLALRRGLVLCPNYIVSTRSLSFPDHSLYAAHEVAQMAPIAGLEVYRRLRSRNLWVRDYLPNAQGRPENAWISPGEIPPRLSRPRLEAVLQTRPFNSIERWEMQRKIRKLRGEQGDSPESHFSADCCKGHAHRHQARTYVALDERLRQLQQEYPL